MNSHKHPHCCSHGGGGAARAGHASSPGEMDGPGQGAAAGPVGAAVYTCPMHPQVRQSGPGTCPICGMSLEPLMPTLEEGHDPELVSFTRRFW